MDRDSFVIAAFRSRQQVMQFIRSMEIGGAKAKVINTPHEIMIGCGLSASFDEKYIKIAKRIIDTKMPPSFVGFYLAQYSGVRLIIKPFYKNEWIK